MLLKRRRSEASIIRGCEEGGRLSQKRSGMCLVVRVKRLGNTSWSREAKKRKSASRCFCQSSASPRLYVDDVGQRWRGSMNPWLPTTKHLPPSAECLTHSVADEQNPEKERATNDYSSPYRKQLLLPHHLYLKWHCVRLKTGEEVCITRSLRIACRNRGAREEDHRVVPSPFQSICSLECWLCMGRRGSRLGPRYERNSTPQN